jgi:drug/metabolite transporter (DMT)-like permease
MGEPKIVFTNMLLISILGLGLASMLIQLVMNWAQKSVPPTRAAVIYTFEPIWAGLAGYLAGESFSKALVLGSIIVICGIITSEVKIGGRS